MASPSRSSSSRGRASSSARSSRSSGGNQQVMVLGGIAVVVVVVLFVMMGGGGDKPAAKPETPAPAAAQPAPAPAATGSGAAKAGKTPARPAPALTADTLAKVRTELAKMKTFYNEGVTARTAGDNTKAREQQALAKDVLDGIDAMIEPPLRWQEEAEMEGWAQPAEYVELARLYNEVMSLAKKVRMGGGK